MARARDAKPPAGLAPEQCAYQSGVLYDRESRPAPSAMDGSRMSFRLFQQVSDQGSSSCNRSHDYDDAARLPLVIEPTVKGAVKATVCPSSLRFRKSFIRFEPGHR